MPEGGQMDRRRMSYFLALLGILILLAILLFAQGTARRRAGITLPDVDQLLEPDLSAPGEERLDLVEIRPDTVQQAVASMDRAAAYTMTVQVETLWSEGSGTAELTAYVRSGLTRVDTLQLDGSVRRTLTDGDTAYVWYDSDKHYATAAAISPDRTLRIPTYEDVVELDPADILAADYQRLKDVYCIYAEANEGDSYTARYWVDTDSGLLVAAQRLYQGEPIYQMTVQSMNIVPPDASFFVLPDGTDLLAAIEEEP